MSADLYNDLTIVLATKNYPKKTPHILKSDHWFQSYDIASGQIGLKLCSIMDSARRIKILHSARQDAPFLCPTNTARKYFHQLKKLIMFYCTSLVA